MSALFSCDTGLYYFDCRGEIQGCCSVNDACSQQNGCPDEAECNGDGETPCGVLCCPDDAQCAYPGYACEGLINGAIVTVIPSPPSSTSTVTSTRTLRSTIIESEISTTGETRASTSDSTTDISTEGVASIVSPSSSPSSQLGLASKVTSLLTSTTTSLPRNATLGPPSSLASSSSSKSHGAAIGGSIGAVAELILAVCLISWLIVWRRRKARGEGSDETQLQDPADNGGGGALDTGNGTNEKTAKSTKSSILTMLSPIRRRRAKHTSKPEPGPVYAEMAEPNGNVSNPELSSDSPSDQTGELPADQIAELPAEVERPVVQAPGRASESSWTDINSNAGTVETAGDNPMSPVSPMSPTLDVGGARRGRSVNRDEHVLSFMNYNHNMPSPVR